MAFKMNYSPNKKTGEGFPYKTHMKAHEEGHMEKEQAEESMPDEENMPNEGVSEEETKKIMKTDLPKKTVSKVYRSDASKDAEKFEKGIKSQYTSKQKKDYKIKS